jgi:hypothetical protein
MVLVLPKRKHGWTRTAAARDGGGVLLPRAV